jgi:hypothetical protein
LNSMRLQHARELASAGVPVAEIADVLIVGRFIPAAVGTDPQGFGRRGKPG